MKSKKILLIAIVFILFLPCTCSIESHASDSIKQNSHTAISSDFSTLSDEIVWKYKWINGVLYKRQYNRTQKKWIGSWVKA